MKKLLHFLSKLFLFVFLTIVTQIGGIALLINEIILRKKEFSLLKKTASFFIVYGILTFLITPFIAPIFGREKVRHSDRISPTNYMTLILNRNYVKPELNQLLNQLDKDLEGTEITINYLDANFPFIDEFPLLPHLSHNDGEKIDLSLIYERSDGTITDQQKSMSGYGVFENPKPNETDQISICKKSGYIQYDFPKYLTFGRIHSDLKFSEKGTKKLIRAILKQPQLGKLFIEPHLKSRLKLQHNKVRYHGCRAVRHDDHIHIQL